MGLLLIGCGYWGQNWADTLAGMGELAAICEGNTAAQVQLQAKFPNVPIYTRLEDALNSEETLEGAIVATPAPTHAALVAQCLQAKLHVLAEKPLALTVNDAEALVALAKEQHRILAVGHICLFYPGMQQLKAWMAEDKLGDILSVTCIRQKLGKIRNEENVWWSFAPHDCSMVLDLLENAPLLVDSVSARRDLGRTGLEDAVTASFVSPHGQTATIQVGWLHPSKQFETIVVGTRGIARLDHAGIVPKGGQTLTLTPHTLTYQVGNEVTLSTAADAQPDTLTWDTLEPPLLTQAKAFFAAIREGKSLPNNAENGLEVVRLLESVQHHLDKLPPCVEKTL